MAGSRHSRPESGDDLSNDERRTFPKAGENFGAGCRMDRTRNSGGAHEACRDYSLSTAGLIRSLLTRGTCRLAHYGRNDGDTTRATPSVINVSVALEDGGE